MIPPVTYVCPILFDVYISRLVYTLHKYSPKGSFKFILIDHCLGGIRPQVKEYLEGKIDLYIRPNRHLGYAKGMNEGIVHALHWGTPYVCCTNDDIEIINPRWLQGIWDTFALDDKRILGVVPMSPRVAGWGYGVKENPEVLPYKKEYTDAEYDYLLAGDFSDKASQLPKTFPLHSKGMVVDGAAFIMPYFKREIFEKIGLLDERFYPGSGEDYDMLCRTYSKDYRIVSTSHSWVWHHWSKTKEEWESGKYNPPYYKARPYFANWEALWPIEANAGHKPDVWGHYTEKGSKIPLIRDPEVFVDQV